MCVCVENEVTPERRTKIKDAVNRVDLDRSEDLDFSEFIQFMRIMEEHNRGALVCC